MVWDYRGYDTLYETSVFFLAIIGAIAVFRIPKVKDVFTKGILSGKGLSLIVKTITKLVIAFVLIVSIAIAVHGNLTPGGGFQAGSAISIATLLALFKTSLNHGLTGASYLESGPSGFQETSSSTTSANLWL
ncbi:MAG: hypothetical protein B6U75_04165 [Desulfurococcales archaeon ex4484_217_1]|nr:MAG: hypothetical protein B6U75_04165 [Desulfurococcales archaeon ex4484_217_1]